MLGQGLLSTNLSRRHFLGVGLAAAGASIGGAHAEPGDTYETEAKGIRIKPGHWRPHYPWEHIAWVSPSWPSQDYLWLDFPEAIFTSRGLIYLSHINPPIDTVYESLPAVPWTETDRGLSFDRLLPSKIAFGGSLEKRDEHTVALELHIFNGSTEHLLL